MIQFIGEHMVGGYIVDYLEENNISIAKLFEWISKNTVISSAIFFLIILISLFIIDIVCEKRKEKKDLRLSMFFQEQKKVITAITELINIAVDDILFYSDGIQYPGEISTEEQRKRAFSSGKELMNFFKEGNNRSYFPKNTRNKIKGLYESISICLQQMSAATIGDFNSNLWNECCKKIKETDEIRDDIFSDFREILKNI